MSLANAGENLWALLQAAVYVLILLEGCCFISLLFQRHHCSRLLGLALCLALSFLLLTILVAGNYQRAAGAVQPLWAAFLALPVWVLPVFLALVYALVLEQMVKSLRSRRSTITRSAVKESVDNLPTGLCFSDKSGAVLLSNRRMQTLCHSLTGSELQDAEQFWAVLNHGPLISGVQRLPGSQSVMLRLPEGSVWQFGRNTIHAGGEEVVELSAADATDLYRLTCQLRENNRSLEDMNRRLQQHNENVEALARSRERLEAKIRIHDDFGQALLATRYLLYREDTALNQPQLLERWRSIVSVLRREAEPARPAGDWESLQAAAAASGVAVRLTGNLPGTGAVRALLIRIAVEALTNAVRHGNATVLNMSVAETSGICTAVFTNNGTVPSGPISLGGGLGALERRLLESGGTMTVTHSPAFRLTVTIPTEGGDPL